jgi:hypothetical protein
MLWDISEIEILKRWRRDGHFKDYNFEDMDVSG